MRKNGWDYINDKNDVALDIKSLNPSILKVQYAVRGPIVIRAAEIQKEIDLGNSSLFAAVIPANIGDAHAVGQIPITYFRQVLSACVCPELINLSIFPSDVNKKARNLLKTMGGDIGCYSHSNGIEYIRKSVAKYIEKRDGYESDYNNIVLTNGASTAVKIILYSFIKKHENQKITGVMVPIPQYPLYSATISEFGGELISYYLNENHNWALDIKECERALLEGTKFSTPRVMVVINPGNPTGQILSYDNMVEIVQFCYKNHLILMADEVYQENIHEENYKFFSFKKVVKDCGFTENNFTLISFHSISKGYYGECGIRGGYMELFGFNPEIKVQLYKLISASLCSSTCGQVIINCIANPPKIGDASFEQFNKEKTSILNEQKKKAEFLYREFNSIPGISCNKIQGALYSFVKLHLQSSREPDEMYCFELLENTGICVIPGSGFKQLPNTYHFRTTILPSIKEITEIAKSIREFNQKLFETYE